MAARDRSKISQQSDDDDDAVVDRDVDNVKKLARKLAKGDSDDEPAEPRRRQDETEIDLDDDDEDEDDEDEDERPTRRQRRQNRFRQVQEDAEEARREAAKLREDIAKLTGGVAMLAQRGFQQASPQAPQGPTDADRRIDTAYERRRSLQREFAALDPKTLTDELYDKYDRRAREVEEELEEARYQKRLERDNIRPVNAQQQQREQMRNALYARHPELQGNKALSDRAEGHYRLLTARGERGDIATWDKAILEGKKELGIGEFAGGGQPGRRADPSRYSGVPRGQGRTTTNTQAKGGKFVMTGEYKAMAENAFPKLPKEQAWKKWAKSVGSKVAASRG